MLKEGDFVLCSGMFRQVSFAQFLAAARDAAFRGIVLGMDVYLRARESGLSDGAIRRMVEDHGLAIEYIDGMVYWIPGAPKPNSVGGGVRIETDVNKFFDVASALGAPLINAVEVLRFDPGREAIAAAFTSICDKAAAQQLKVCLEFTPIGAVPDLRAAGRIIDLARRENGGILLDTWHFARSSSPISDINTIAVDRYFAVQLSDTLETPMPDIFKEAMHHRLLPGEGSAGIARILTALFEHGVRRPYDAEVYCDELLVSNPPAEVLRRTVAAMRTVVPVQARRT